MHGIFTRQNAAFYTLIFVMIMVSLGPILLMLSTSLRLNVEIMSDTSSMFFMPTLKNYETVLCNVLWYTPEHVDYCSPTFARSLGNSLIVALVSTVITLIVGCMASYALVRFRFMGRGTVSMTTLMMRMVPPAVLLVPVFGIWTFQYGLDGTFTGIVLVYVAMNLPFVIWILQSFIVQVPIQLEEAARMDGATPMQVFFLVVLPVIKECLHLCNDICGPYERIFEAFSDPSKCDGISFGFSMYHLYGRQSTWQFTLVPDVEML